MTEHNLNPENLAGQHRMGLEADSVLRLGLLMVAAGTGGYRVVRAMKRAARSMGFDSLDAEITVTSITCTFHRKNTFRTVVAVQTAPAVDASRIEALEHLTHNLPQRLTAEALNMCLDNIEHNVVHRWPKWILMLAAGCACAAFAVLNYYPIMEATIVAVAAACGQLMRSSLAKRKLNQLGVVAIAAITACLVFYGLSQIVVAVIGSDLHSITAGYVAAVLFLIPGFPLFSSLLDLSRFDIIAGLSRLCYAMTVIAAATMSVALVSSISGLSPLPLEPPEPSLMWFATAAAASFVGIAGFAFLFNSSKRMVIIAASLGMVANIVRLLLIAANVQPQFAAFAGGLSIGLLGALLARRTLLPRITMTVPAAVIMIPGTAMYRAVHFLNTGDINQAISNTATAGLIVMWISAGLITARMLTDRDWAFGRNIDFGKYR